MNNFSYKLGQFFSGRRGTDELNLALFLTAIVLQIVGGIFGVSILYYIAYALLATGVFRMLSKNIYAREIENRKFLTLWNKIRGKKTYNSGANNKKNKKKPNKKNSKIQYCYYHCPQCKQQVRVPAGKGKVVVTCPSCKSKFDLTT